MTHIAKRCLLTELKANLNNLNEAGYSKENILREERETSANEIRIKKKEWITDEIFVIRKKRTNNAKEWHRLEDIERGSVKQLQAV